MDLITGLGQVYEKINIWPLPGWRGEFEPEVLHVSLASWNKDMNDNGKG